MAKRNVIRLNTGQVFFTVIGISSHENDYRLSWSMNEQLGLAFVQGDSLIAVTGNEFSCFVHEDDEQAFMLISNRCDNGFLLEKHRNIDYILRFNVELNETETQAWLRILRGAPLVSAAFSIRTTKQILQALG